MEFETKQRNSGMLAPNGVAEGANCASQGVAIISLGLSNRWIIENERIELWRQIEERTQGMPYQTEDEELQKSTDLLFPTGLREDSLLQLANRHGEIYWIHKSTGRLMADETKNTQK